MAVGLDGTPAAEPDGSGWGSEIVWSSRTAEARSFPGGGSIAICTNPTAPATRTSPAEPKRITLPRLRRARRPLRARRWPEGASTSARRDGAPAYTRSSSSGAGASASTGVPHPAQASAPLRCRRQEWQ
ncbi:hypothetical protein ADK54_39245 [Streptomyces sp. WM6378]|nr:hypothetical protein ADK54_39245 [Streptomyces sp. WM6378]